MVGSSVGQWLFSLNNCCTYECLFRHLMTLTLYCYLFSGLVSWKKKIFFFIQKMCFCMLTPPLPNHMTLGKSLWFLHLFSSVQSLSPCLTLCDPMDCSTPGFPVHHQLLEPAQTHVHRVSDAIQPSYLLLSPSPLPSIFPSIRVFSNELVLHIRWPKYLHL